MKGNKMRIIQFLMVICIIFFTNISNANADVTEEITAIAKDIKNNPGLWSVNQHNFCRYDSIAKKVESNYCSSSSSSSLTIWISNGVDYIRITHPYQLRLGTSNRVLLWDAYISWLDNYRHTYMSKNFKEYKEKISDKDKIKIKKDTQDRIIKFLEDKKEPKKEFLDPTIAEEEDEGSMDDAYELVICALIVLVLILACALIYMIKNFRPEVIKKNGSKT